MRIITAAVLLILCGCSVNQTYRKAAVELAHGPSNKYDLYCWRKPGPHKSTKGLDSYPIDLDCENQDATPDLNSCISDLSDHPVQRPTQITARENLLVCMQGKGWEHYNYFQLVQ